MERSFGYSSVASLSTHQVVQNLEPLPCYNRDKRGILTEPCDKILPSRYLPLWSAMYGTCNGLDCSLFVRNDMVLNTFVSCFFVFVHIVGVQNPEPLLCHGDIDLVPFLFSYPHGNAVDGWVIVIPKVEMTCRSSFSLTFLRICIPI